MSQKRKLQNYSELNTFNNILQPSVQAVYERDHELKGLWNEKYLQNPNPIVLELGCGKGEYTNTLAKQYPDKNFIGVDIKGARLWHGCRAALDGNIKNASYLRTKVEFITSFYTEGEISEIWITFPDPQIKKQKKRLTSSRFLNNYNKIISPKGIIHLKTDSLMLHEYTLDIIKFNNLELLFATNDLYNSSFDDEILSVKTFYEKKFLALGMPITYLKFRIPTNSIIVEPY